jgi:hypothetical protein
VLLFMEEAPVKRRGHEQQFPASWENGKRDTIIAK